MGYDGEISGWDVRGDALPSRHAMGSICDTHAAKLPCGDVVELPFGATTSLPGGYRGPNCAGATHHRQGRRCGRRGHSSICWRCTVSCTGSRRQPRSFGKMSCRSYLTVYTAAAADVHETHTVCGALTHLKPLDSCCSGER